MNEANLYPLGGLELRLRHIENRLDRIERHVDLPQPLTAAAEVPAAQIPLATVRPAAIDPAAPPIAPLPAAKVAPVNVSLLAYKTPDKPAPASTTQSHLEQLIGLKLAGWIGALVLVIGAGLGIKFLYDIHFFAGVPPIVWLALLWTLGLGLIGAGEYVFRKIHAISATGLFGAGVAMLFLTSYAGYGYYQLYSQLAAFVLMALAVLLGAAVAMRGRLVSIAALSLLGGMLAPLVLHRNSTLVAPLLIYLLALQVVALFLSGWGGSSRWWVLRVVALAGTALWLADAAILHAQAWGIAMWFCLIYAVLYQVEIIVSSIRVRNEQHELTGAGATFSILVTGLLTCAILWIFRDASPLARGLWVASFAAMNLSTGVALPRLLKNHVTIAALAWSYRAQSMTLAMLVIPLTFSGATISLGWTALALALAATGSKLNDRIARAGGVIAWGLAIVHLVIWMHIPANVHAAHRTLLVLFGQPVAAWACMAIGIGLIGHVIAWLMRDPSAPHEEDWSGSAIVSTLASTVIVAAAVIAFPPLVATGLCLAYAWLLFFANSFGSHLQLLQQSAGLFGICAVKWMIVDTLARRLAPAWFRSSAPPLQHLQPLLGTAIASSLIAIYALRRGIEGDKNGRAGTPVALAALVLLLWAGTLEIDHVFSTSSALGAMIADQHFAEQVALSVFWSIFAIASIIGGFVHPMRGVRYFGLALFAVTLLKIGVVDLQNAQTGYRILSFLALGGLLLGTSVIYGRLTPRLLAGESAGEVK